jgi:anti-sigma regulatory factor (Ser/Thr protein kinase)
VRVVVTATDAEVRVAVTDRAVHGPDPGPAEEPDLEAKLAGSQKPRGWGLFLIKHMVDAMEVATDGAVQTVTLTLHLGRDADGDDVQR